MEELATPITSSLDALKILVYSLENVVMDNRIALDYLLAAHRGVCVVANTSSCTWVNTKDRWNEM